MLLLPTLTTFIVCYTHFFLFQCIEDEFCRCNENHIESVVILFGANVLNPLTVFNIYVPKLSYSHCEKQHSSRNHIHHLFK